MVNPISLGPNPVQYGQVAGNFDRPTPQPEAAVLVTAGAEARDTGTATSSQHQSGSEERPENIPLEKALEALNNNMEAWSTGMRFDMDDEAQRLVVSIIDSKTGDVIRTVPSDAVIRVAKMIVQLQGSMVNTKA